MCVSEISISAAKRTTGRSRGRTTGIGSWMDGPSNFGVRNTRPAAPRRAGGQHQIEGQAHGQEGNRKSDYR